MPDRATATSNSSRDQALAAIREAYRMLGQADQGTSARAAREKEIETAHPLPQSRASRPVKTPSRPGMMSTTLGLLLVAGVAAALFAWRSERGPIAREGLSSSSPLPGQTDARSAATGEPHQAGVTRVTAAGPPLSQAQAASPSAPAASPSAPIAFEQAQQIEQIANELANLSQRIDQLRTEQSQTVRDNAELSEQLKAARELARHNAELAEDLKRSQLQLQAQMAREVADLTEQLKANQAVLAAVSEQLKQSQEKTASIAASQPKPRPRTPLASPVAATTAVPRPAVRRPAPPPASPAQQPRPQ